MRTIYRLPAAIALGIGLNVAGHVASAEGPPSDDPASTYETPLGPCEWGDECPPPQPEPEPESPFDDEFDELSIEADDPCELWGDCPPEPDPDPVVDGPDDVTTEPDDPCDLWGDCPPPPDDPCADEPFVADDIVAPGLEDEPPPDAEIDDLVANPCLPDDDDDDDDPGSEPCVLDEVCSGDPTFTG